MITVWFPLVNPLPVPASSTFSCIFTPYGSVLLALLPLRYFVLSLFISLLLTHASFSTKLTLPQTGHFTSTVGGHASQSVAGITALQLEHLGRFLHSFWSIRPYFSVFIVPCYYPVSLSCLNYASVFIQIRFLNQRYVPPLVLIVCSPINMSLSLYVNIIIFDAVDAVALLPALSR